MIAVQNKKSQGLFSVPSCAETAVWCELNEEIDPAEWANICRNIGQLNIAEFKSFSAALFSQVKSLSGVKKNKEIGIPLVSLGCSGIGGEYQKEID